MKLSSLPQLLYHPNGWFLLRAVINFPTFSLSHVRAAGRSLPVFGVTWSFSSRWLAKRSRCTVASRLDGATQWSADMMDAERKIYTFLHITEQMMWESCSPNTHTHRRGSASAKSLRAVHISCISEFPCRGPISTLFCIFFLFCV